MAKVLHDLRDLEEFGIRYLTGEACLFSQRVLCDVDAKGKATVLDLMGLPPEAPMNEGWNRHGISSVMIPRDLFGQLMVWCLIRDGAYRVVTTSNGYTFGFYPGEEDEADKWLSFHRGANLVRHVIERTAGQPGVGTRATHQFTGRTT